MKADHIKANGVHYTPPELAKFLADVMAERILVTTDAIEILDPACGGGALLFAFSQVVPRHTRERLILCGYETDANALRQAAELLATAGVREVVLEQRDFLAIEGIDVAAPRGQLSLLDNCESATPRQFDAVIANPPYVRTQLLGAATAQKLARRFGLTGRVDLYHAFTKGMANVLKPGGVLGLLTSNRFLTIKSGASLRRLLRSEFSLEAIYDLGDTKLFTAAVLPVIVVARKQRGGEVRCAFDRIYEHRTSAEVAPPKDERIGILDAFRDQGVQGIVHTQRGTFKIERGVLEATRNDEAWSLSTSDYQEWLERVAARQCYTFDDVASVRVGIKTTADDVYIHDDWARLPTNLRPEAELLRPLITHVETERWLPTTPTRRVLYTHTIENGKRVPIRLEDYPRAKAYLESHEGRLSSRKYVVEARRQWFEIWVPHNPSDWRKPKITSPDIAEEPRFCLDRSGAIVNGDCYWMTLRPGFKREWLLLLLAVGNSSFVTRYYDIAFHNKLYAGRRRFMAQYVKSFPLPTLESPVVQKILPLVDEQIASSDSDADREMELNQLVWESFGLVGEVCR